MTILEDVLKHIPFTTEDMTNDDVFSTSIKNYTSNALSILYQNGIGTPLDLISEPDVKWEDFFSLEQFTNKAGVQYAKMYVYTSVQILFDTPQPNVLSVLKDHRSENLYRARLEFEDTLWKNTMIPTSEEF